MPSDKLWISHNFEILSVKDALQNRKRTNHVIGNGILFYEHDYYHVNFRQNITEFCITHIKIQFYDQMSDFML